MVLARTTVHVDRTEVDWKVVLMGALPMRVWLRAARPMKVLVPVHDNHQNSP